MLVRSILCHLRRILCYFILYDGSLDDGRSIKVLEVKEREIQRLQEHVMAFNKRSVECAESHAHGGIGTSPL